MDEVWNSKEAKTYPGHDIHQKLTTGIVATLLAFHAITVCHSVSQFQGHSK